MTGLPIYPDCEMKRKAPNGLNKNQDIIRALGEDYRVLPTFEKAVYEYKYRRHYSLNTNGLLKCRLRSYVQHIEQRKVAPFNFIDIRDFHFYNCMNRFISSESFHKKKEFRYTLKAGPGVDLRGQMPIPQELFMDRSFRKPRTEPKRYPTPQNEEQGEIIDEKVGEKE